MPIPRAHHAALQHYTRPDAAPEHGPADAQAEVEGEIVACEAIFGEAFSHDGDDDLRCLRIDLPDLVPGALLVHITVA